jgi:hypothetical protein
LYYGRIIFRDGEVRRSRFMGFSHRAAIVLDNWLLLWFCSVLPIKKDVNPRMIRETTEMTVPRKNRGASS